jgi:hypothetical protein
VHARKGRGRGERTARWAIGAWALLWIGHDALPYLGLRDDSCQTMFSSLEWGLGEGGRSWNNHLVVPQHMVGDLWTALELSDVSVEGEPRDARERALVRWLRQPDRALNAEALRVVVDQLCEAHRVSFSYRRRLGEPSGDWGLPRVDTPLVRVDDACGDPALAEPHRWVPVRLFETDYPIDPPEAP